MNKSLLYFYILFPIIGLTGCDSALFNELFRNPHIVEIGHLDSIESDKWYEFNTKFTAINKTQKIRITFSGSAPQYIDTVDSTDHSSILYHTSSQYPNQPILFQIIAIDNNGNEYSFIPSGHSSGLIYRHNGQEQLFSITFNKFKVSSTANLSDLTIDWISYTGK